jgi:hypothetical protein
VRACYTSGMKCFQVDVSGQVIVAAGVSDADVVVQAAHVMDNPEEPDDRPHDLVFMAITRSGSDETDGVGLSLEAAKSLAEALMAKVVEVEMRQSLKSMMDLNTIVPWTP